MTEHLQDSEELDEILLTFAKRVEKIPRGKTYGWEAEKRSVLAYIQRQILQAKISLLNEHTRNSCYTSGANKVDYVPLFRLQDHVEILESQLNQLNSIWYERPFK